MRDHYKETIMEDEEKVVYGIAGVSVMALAYQTWRIRKMRKQLDEFVTEAGKAVDSIYQLAVDVEFDDMTRNLDMDI